MAEEGEDGTIAQQKEITTARSALQRQIQSWRLLQPTHMGAAMSAVEQRMDEQRTIQDIAGTPLQPEGLYIVLPSHFMAPFRKAHHLEVLANIELNIRLGAATDCIRSIRNELRYRAAVHRFQSNGFNSQRQNTRSIAKLNTVQNRVDHHAAAYRRHREALLVLGVSKDNAPELRSNDIVALNKWSFGDAMETGQKDRQISWLWLTEGIAEECKTDANALEGEGEFCQIVLSLLTEHPQICVWSTCELSRLRIGGRRRSTCLPRRWPGR